MPGNTVIIIISSRFGISIVFLVSHPIKMHQSKFRSGDRKEALCQKYDLFDYYYFLFSRTFLFQKMIGRGNHKEGNTMNPNPEFVPR